MTERGWCAGAADCSYATGLQSPMFVAVDPNRGVLYVVSSYGSTVCRVPAGGGASIFPVRRGEEEGVIRE